MDDSRTALPVTAIALDAKGYSTHTGSVHLEWRQSIREILAKTWRHTVIDPATLAVQDTGDGFLILVPADVPKAVVLADFVRELSIALSEYNMTRSQQARLRIRLAMHHGDAIVDGTGFADEAAITVSRLVDSSPVRAAIDNSSDVELALIISDGLFRDTVAKHYRGLDPRDFRRVEVDTVKFRGTAWIRVLGADIPRSQAPGERRAPHQPNEKIDQVMDTSAVKEVAQYLWPLVVGAVYHVGATAADEISRRGQGLLARVSAHRRRAGLDDRPGDVDELARELSRVVTDEPDGRNEVATFYRRMRGDASVNQRDHNVNNTIYGNVQGSAVNFGVQSR